MKEEWEDIPEYEDMYQISNLGRVRSLSRTYVNSLGHSRKLKTRFMSLVPNSDGYLEFACCKKGKYKRFSVHRLVAKLFLSNEFNLPQVNHIDGDKTNNSYDNLEWCTISYNIQHAYDTGLKYQKTGVDHYAAKLSEEDVIEILDLLKSKQWTLKEIGSMYNVSFGNISSIKNGRTWKYLNKKT